MDSGAMLGHGATAQADRTKKNAAPFRGGASIIATS
jgi:hypothetical protein